MALALVAGLAATPTVAQDPFAALAAPVASRFAGAGDRVLALGLTTPTGAITGLEQYLSQRLTAALTATGRVSFTDDAARERALGEIHANLADVFDQNTVQAAGRLAGASWLLKGTAYVFEARRRADIMLQLIRTETGEYWQTGGSVALDADVLRLRSLSVVEPRQAPKRPPLSLEMVVVASRPGPGGRDTDLGEVREGDRLRSNDDVKVYFKTSAAAWVYLVWVDTRGRATLQFPAKNAGTDNRVTGGALHWIPSRENYWIPLDNQTGTETLYLVGSHEPLANLDALLRQAETGSFADAARAREGIERLFADLETRGVGGVRPGGTERVRGRGAEPVSAEVSVVSGYAQAVRRLSFRHDP